MRRSTLFGILVVLVAAAGIWFFVSKNKKENNREEEIKPEYVSKHSAAFNESIHQMLTAYYNMTEGFVNWDSAMISSSSSELQEKLESLHLDDLKNDSLVYAKAGSDLGNINADLESIKKDPSIAEKRGSLNILSKIMFEFLNSVRYDVSRIYFQECPMAFDDVNPGNWLSPTEKVRNPYLGTKHPKYKSGMLECGGPTDSLNFMQ